MNASHSESRLFKCVHSFYVGSFVNAERPSLSLRQPTMDITAALTLMTTRAENHIKELSDKLEHCKRELSRLHLHARAEEGIGLYFLYGHIEELRRTENDFEGRLVRTKQLLSGIESIAERLPALHLARQRLLRLGNSMLSKLPSETMEDIVEFMDLDAFLERPKKRFLGGFSSRSLFWLVCAQWRNCALFYAEKHR